MKDVKVIPHKKYVNTVNGRVASIYGSAPWLSDEEKKDWELRVEGYTWEVTDHNGCTTIGLCRKPAKTYEEAVEVANRVMSL